MSQAVFAFEKLISDILKTNKKIQRVNFQQQSEFLFLS